MDASERADTYHKLGLVVNKAKQSGRRPALKETINQRKNNLTTQQKLTRHLQLIRREAIILHQQLEQNPEALDLSINFTIHHNYSHFSRIHSPSSIT